MKMDIDQIKQTIYDIVVCIPEGCVTTYLIAMWPGLLGCPIMRVWSVKSFARHPKILLFPAIAW